MIDMIEQIIRIVALIIGSYAGITTIKKNILDMRKTKNEQQEKRSDNNNLNA